MWNFDELFFFGIILKSNPKNRSGLLCEDSKTDHVCELSMFPRTKCNLNNKYSSPISSVESHCILYNTLHIKSKTPPASFAYQYEHIYKWIPSRYVCVSWCAFVYIEYPSIGNVVYTCDERVHSCVCVYIFISMWNERHSTPASSNIYRVRLFRM